MLNIDDAIERVNEHPEDLRLVRLYERRQLKLGKRLAYLLRYGAEKEGCRVDEGMFYARKYFLYFLIKRLDFITRFDESTIAY
jgi:RNA:NAD 2'-phosphotransferase (TPT1/KptA family)